MQVDSKFLIHLNFTVTSRPWGNLFKLRPTFRKSMDGVTEKTLNKSPSIVGYGSHCGPISMLTAAASLLIFPAQVW